MAILSTQRYFSCIFCILLLLSQDSVWFLLVSSPEIHLTLPNSWWTIPSHIMMRPENNAEIFQRFGEICSLAVLAVPGAADQFSLRPRQDVGAVSLHPQHTVVCPNLSLEDCLGCIQSQLYSVNTGWHGSASGITPFPPKVLHRAADKRPTRTIQSSSTHRQRTNFQMLHGAGTWM